MAKRFETTDGINLRYRQLGEILAFLERQNLSEHSRMKGILSEIVDIAGDTEYAEIIRRLNDEDYALYEKTLEALVFELGYAISGSENCGKNFQALNVGNWSDFFRFLGQNNDIPYIRLMNLFLAFVNGDQAAAHRLADILHDSTIEALREVSDTSAKVTTVLLLIGLPELAVISGTIGVYG